MVLCNGSFYGWDLGFVCLRLWVLGLGSWVWGFGFGLVLGIWAQGFGVFSPCLREPCLDLGIWERQIVPLADLFREDYGFACAQG